MIQNPEFYKGPGDTDAGGFGLAAVAAMLSFDAGVLCAPNAFGKTVTAAARVWSAPSAPATPGQVVECHGSIHPMQCLDVCMGDVCARRLVGAGGGRARLHAAERPADVPALRLRRTSRHPDTNADRGVSLAMRRVEAMQGIASVLIEGGLVSALPDR